MLAAVRGPADAEGIAAAAPHVERWYEEGGDCAWPVWAQLDALTRAPRPPPASRPRAAVLLFFAFPTAQMRADARRAIASADRYLPRERGAAYPLVIFTDPGSGASVVQEFRDVWSGTLLPAIIPEDALSFPITPFTCPISNSSWSANYLRISRYSAGPLFFHPILDQFSHFLKIDTDFFFTGPFHEDPLEKFMRLRTKLAWWQLHVQGQRQEGFQQS